MGRNAAIKRFDATRAGQPLELLETRASHRAVVAELRASPWIVRATELVRRDGSSVAKRADEPVVVEWDAEQARPVAFRRGAKRYRVDAVLQVWVSEKAWWDPRRHVSRRYWRVLSLGGVYDLAFDRADGVWRLIGIQD